MDHCIYCSLNFLHSTIKKLRMWPDEAPPMYFRQLVSCLNKLTTYTGRPDSEHGIRVTIDMIQDIALRHSKFMANQINAI